jgi:hypothetical protein
MGLVGGRLLEEPFTYDVAQNLALRVYPDRRPGNLEIAGIHKALVLVRGGVEVVEEGAGFGLPIAKYRDKTYFPGSATLTLVEGTPVPVVVKTYRMDTISVKSLGGSRISDAVYHPVHGLFSRLYLSLGALRPAFDAVIELRNAAGVRTSFETTTSRGEVEVRYTLHPGRVEIEASPMLAEGCEKLVLLNEQGASTFRVYSDASRRLVEKQMGAWDRVDEPEATLSDLGGGLSFTVERPRGAGLWRGRESVRGRLSWAGLALSFASPETVRYTVRVDS